jgi:Xaa-Pro aminopeptidase
MGIEQQEYRQRREKLMAAIGQGTAIFRSAPQAVMHNDVEYNFRQDSNFYYVTGFNEPNAVAVLAPHHEEHKFVLFVQPKDLDKEIWTGYLTGVEAAKELYGADEVYSIAELDEHLPKYLQESDRLFYRFGLDQSFDQKILRHWQRLLATIGRRGTGPIAVEDTRTLMNPLRSIKSPAEIAMVKKAVAISAEAHLVAMDMAKPGRFEYEIQAEMERLFRLQGGDFAYPSIVATGANACILHYTQNNALIKEGDLLLIDAGCTHGYYNGDITRTFPVSRKFTYEQQALYEITLEAQLQAIAAVKPGNPSNSFHDAAVKVIVEGLLELGLLTGDAEEIIKEKKYKPFYMHNTGHWLGLDVHDAGFMQYGGKDHWLPFAPGQVVTVEPGIYINPNIKPVEGQPEIPDRWKGIGIRIEDDVLVTEQDHEILSAAAPKAIEDLID